MDKDLKLRLAQAIHAARGNAGPGVEFNAGVIARTVMDALSQGDRDQIVLGFIAEMAAQMEKRADEAAASQTGWLDLLEYQNIRAAVRAESLEEFRARIETLEKRIDSYAYARRATEKLERDELELREMRALEVKIAPFFAGDREMTVEKAVELYKKQQAKPAFQRQKKAIRARWDRRTKNQ